MYSYRLALRRAFTLIELLVVVAIIALLISILLPSLTCAREQARAAKCGAQLRSIGRGTQTYMTEEQGYIPGVNTSGVAATAAGIGRSVARLRSAGTPVQNFDWMSPSVRYEMSLGSTRAQRFLTLINYFGCPTFQGIGGTQLYPFGLPQNSVPDREDFTSDVTLDFQPVSYLMPVHFQWWGRKFEGMVIGTSTSGSGLSDNITARVSPASFDCYHPGDYKSKIEQVGDSSRKVLAADGMRYMTEDLTIDFDVTPGPTWFGAFTSNGAWLCLSEAYGVKNNTVNWDGDIVSAGSLEPASRGRALVWSYRHGCTDRNAVTDGVQSNKGMINAAFFDGHVARLDDRQSRQIDLWYPSGSVVQNSGPSHGLTSLDVGFEVP